MTITELHALVVAVCPVLGIDTVGNIQFDPTATIVQQAAAQAVVTANLAKVNMQPSRIPLDILNIYQYIKPGGTGNLTQAQQFQIALACASVVLAEHSALSARINTALGLSIPYDQANPKG